MKLSSSFAESCPHGYENVKFTCTPTMRMFAPITDMMLKLRKVMEDMKKKPKKKEGKPNSDEDLCF
jgi:hypothetical protein